MKPDTRSHPFSPVLTRPRAAVTPVRPALSIREAGGTGVTVKGTGVETQEQPGGCAVYTLTLKALPDEAPPIIRLRRFLKAALRQWRFRCLRAVRNGGQRRPRRPADHPRQRPPARNHLIQDQTARRYNVFRGKDLRIADVFHATVMLRQTGKLTVK